jgi:hypothetical protein
MKTKIKKLNVSKQTIANLEDSEARTINGGFFPWPGPTFLCDFTNRRNTCTCPSDMGQLA